MGIKLALNSFVAEVRQKDILCVVSILVLG